MFKFNKSSRQWAGQAGQVSRLLLVLAIIILVAAVITYLVLKMAEKPVKPPTDITPQVQLPVYEKQLGNIRFIFESALSRGNLLKAVDIKNAQYENSYQKDLPVSNSGAKFIQVTIGAQNMGTVNIEQNSWDIGNIVDSKDRNFVPLDSYSDAPWLPNPNLCGTLLKPAFSPTPCSKIYEVSKESTGLKINVITGKDNSANNLSGKKTEEFLIDLIVK